MAQLDYWEVDDPANTTAIWNRLIGTPYEDDAETSRQANLILDGIQAGERCLELGAGVGRLMKAVDADHRFSEVHGVDSSISLVMAGQRYLEWNPNCHLVLGDGLRLPYPEAHFDFAYSYTVLQHMISLAMIHRNLTELHRVLRPGAWCRLQTVASGEHDPRDLSEYDGRVFHGTMDFAERIMAAGLEVVTVREGLTHPQHIWATAKRP